MFASPALLTPYSFWQEHIPFGMFLVQLLEPRLLVELGTHYGDSYCAFCQAVKGLALPTRCYAVDNWQGDIHTSTYGEDVLNGLREHHDPLYSSFSTLLQSEFALARARFADGTIDLLHLDGTHTYEAVKADFFGWLPKLSERGVVLFHDTNVFDRPRFGVWKFFNEIKNSYPHFEFLHGYGLGILAVGPEQPAAFRALLAADDEQAATLRQFFFFLGQRLNLLRLYKQQQQTDLKNADEMLYLREHLAQIQEQSSQLLEQARELQEQLTQREQLAHQLFKQIEAITSGTGWALLQKAWAIRARLRSVGRAHSMSDSDVAPNDQSLAPVEDSPQLSPTVETPATLAAVAADTHQATAGQLPRPSLTTEVLEVLNDQTRTTLAGLAGEQLRLIAFYLPQFHPIPENDQWWGKGFTEWTNVAKATPKFIGHYQPQLPSDLGFYDLRVPEVREQQAELARAYGIHGFCYHHYWFGGQRLLERPFNEVLSSGRPDFPFCICWANENWTRRWDGLENEVLIAQSHSIEDDRNFIRSLFPAFEDLRYIRVNGRPLLIVYRVNILPNARQTSELWRTEAQRAGIGDLYLVAAQSFGITDPRPFGFDAAVEFPPFEATSENLALRLMLLTPDYVGSVNDYGISVSTLLHRAAPDYKLLKGVMPGWDNTPRRPCEGHVFLHSTPDAYKYWLGQAVNTTLQTHQGDEQLVFINAWNEWGEGAHLEPDREYGYQYLEATRNVVLAARGKV